MSQVAQCHKPGLLLVLSEPKSSACLAEFHDWYNTEHGPARMKLDFVKNGLRYSSVDTKSTIWAGVYDLERVSAVSEPQYTALRKHRSPREQMVMNTKLNILERKIYKSLSSRGHIDAPAPVMLKVTFVVKAELAARVNEWYEREHIDDLAKIPGWQRSRRFEAVTEDGRNPDLVELLAIHEFREENGLGGREHIFARSRPWRNEILNLIEARSNTQFEFYHEFRAEDYRRPPDYIPAQSRHLTQSGEGLSELHSGLNVSEQEELKVVAAHVLPAVS